MRIPGSDRTDRNLTRFDLQGNPAAGWSGLPLQVETEAVNSLTARSEALIPCRWVADPPSHPVALAYFPHAGRGAVAAGDLMLWTDCTSLDDLEDRWATYPARWSD